MANIYEKLQSMRVELQEMKLKKSGKNKFAGYDYYELADILPPINSIMARNKVCSIITFNAEQAELQLVNAEKPDERVTFTSPMAEASLKGTHPIQNLGAVETYQRRYLYMTAFEIVENDFLDATQGQQQGNQGQQKPQQGQQQGNQGQKQGNQGQQRRAAKPQQEKQKLSPENGQFLNEQIKFVSENEGMTVKEVMGRIEQHMDKSIKQIEDKDVDDVMEFLETLITSDPF